mmetsp:Transcript_37373/g.117758  ORF Transcript_37373/g.117758 Transcript_37373/m.117758 type:complete len:213 (-) Transcript_37373:141-779(-)
MDNHLHTLFCRNRSIPIPVQRHELADVVQLLGLPPRPVIAVANKHGVELIQTNTAIAVFIHLPDHLLHLRNPVLVDFHRVVPQSSQAVLQLFLVDLVVSLEVDPLKNSLQNFLVLRACVLPSLRLLQQHLSTLSAFHAASCHTRRQEQCRWILPCSEGLSCRALLQNECQSLYSPYKSCRPSIAIHPVRFPLANPLPCFHLLSDISLLNEDF